MKKILFIAPLETKKRFKGGIASFAEPILANPTIFEDSSISFTGFNNCLVKRSPKSSGRLSFLNILNLIKVRVKMRKVLKQDHYDAIYLNTSFGLALLKDLFTIKRQYKKKYCIFLHIHFADMDSIFTKNKFIRKLIKKNLSTRITTIVTLSWELKKQLIQNGFSKESIVVLYNYYDPRLPLISDNDLDKKFIDKEKRPTLFLFMGSLDKRKGFYDLIQIFKSIPSEKAKLIICGSPNDEFAEVVLKEISSYPQFIYKGYVEGAKKNQAFMSADVFVLPSYGEGLPITILEALHFGLPVISTNVGAIPEIISEKDGCRLLPPGNLVRLEQTIHEYCNSDLLATSKKCLNKSQCFSFSLFAANLKKILLANIRK